MKQRLEQFLSAENLTKAQFADSINVARAAVSHIIAGRNKPGYEFIVNTMKKYPQLSIEWLLTGVGRMYKNIETQSQQPQTYETEEPNIFSDTLNKTTYQNISKEVTQINTKSSKVKKIFVLYEDGTYGEFC